MVTPPASAPSTVRAPAASRVRATADRLLASRHDPLIRNAYILTLSSVGTSLFGAVYWALGARWYNADVVGRNYAAVSAMMLLGGIGQLNLGNVMIRFVPSAGRRTGRLVGRAYLATVVTTLLLTAVFVLLVPRISPGLDFLHSAVLGSCFVAATAVYAIFNLQDGVLTGLRLPGWVALENGVFSVEKIVLLAVLVALGAANGILVSWMVALALILVMTNAYIFARAIPRHRVRPPQAQADTSTATVGYVAADYAGALCWLVATNLPPVIILNRLGAADSAYYSLAWLVAFVLYFFSSNMGYSLIVESTNNFTRLRDYRHVLWHAGWVLAAVVVPLVALAPWLLGVFGADYSSHGTTALRLLALSALPNLLTTTVVAMSRVRRRMRVVVGVLALQATLVIALTLALLPGMGLDGAAAAWLIAQVVVAGVLMWRSSWWLPEATAVEAGCPAGSGRLHEAEGVGSPREPVLPRVVPLTPPALLCLLPDRRTARRLARQVYPDTAVTTGRPQRTPGGLLVVRVDTPGRPPIAVKHPFTPRAARVLDQERRILRRLAEDRRLAEIRPLLPSEVAVELDASLPLAAQTWLPGTGAATLLHRAPDTAPQVTAAALTAIAGLHRASGRPEPAASHAEEWIDARTAVLSREIAWCRRDEGAACLEALRVRLHAGLADRTDRTMTVGWTHGDFAPGNILLTGSRVTGVLDWSTADPDGPVDLDAYTLVLTLESELGGPSLGRVIAEVVRSGALTPGQRRLLGDIGSAESDAALLPLLTWLWHVANNVSKSPRYGRSVRWVRGTVVPVLRAVAG